MIYRLHIDKKRQLKCPCMSGVLYHRMQGRFIHSMREEDRM